MSPINHSLQQTRLQETLTNAFERLARIKNQTELEALRAEFIGRQGVLARLMDELKTLSLEEKRVQGPALNELKKTLTEAFTAKEVELLQQLLEQKAARASSFDVTAYRPGSLQGSLHPASHIIEEVENILISMGYEIIDGPEIEREEINFEALNIPKNHPARDLQDTFWLTIPHLLPRTHTSSVQIRGMQQRQPPLALATTGRCYRQEATDASHDFVFMQCEILLVDKKISLANLFATAKLFLQGLFKQEKLELRIRPSYFPFVEPGLEMDMSCPFCSTGCSVCKKSRWIEIGGAGLIHPHVLKASGINPEEYSGFAFGFGLTRLIMLKYGIDDIRHLHSSKVDFLKQF
ncbi:TPA: phenylalanine--tRNA ligase subunit alpha [Candidatus Dependentiae bacterium]|nr:MAG: Phenylalanine-tRNA ligase alpha subunit [candidate division TM6 bacterium GW2011_GWF2_43_87]HBL98798.1 phenylalanine--tRNA ligase subunit alpha [Candidatus Dependentiae bacterium]